MKVRRANMLKVKREINISDEPMSIAQAIAHPYADHFMGAFADEIASLNDMSTWRKFFGDASDIPKGLLLSSKVVFSIVYNPDGTFKKFKARLVARGDQLKHPFDPDTYAGTAHSETLRLFFSVVATLDYDIESHDVKTAFLHPSLKPDEKSIFVVQKAPQIRICHLSWNFSNVSMDCLRLRNTSMSM